MEPWKETTERTSIHLRHEQGPCGSEYQACPKCQDGWLVERKGRYGKFLGCVKFPRCSGKAKIRVEKSQQS
ncbi:topoisomerase DNA-binding C4 zinc finger domain-containing protein [Ruegeria marisrubri]|nr:topoisomerase DNA-binding C4 zinc finger domain-containing protein [Ruegeria marisrubri]MCA0905433.1 topoisomerase DNA-binding C4 zinc finger domain-containing protein [Ruegeria marisrubri]